MALGLFTAPGPACPPLGKLNWATVSVSFLLAIVRVDTVVVSARFATVNCWRAVLSLVAASAKLLREPARASMTSGAAAGMMLFAPLANGSSVAPARWRFMPRAYAAK